MALTRRVSLASPGFLGFARNDKLVSALCHSRASSVLAREAALAVLSLAKELDRAETLHFVQGDRKRSSRVFALHQYAPMLLFEVRPLWPVPI